MTTQKKTKKEIKKEIPTEDGKIKICIDDPVRKRDAKAATKVEESIKIQIPALTVAERIAANKLKEE
jgi:hypothetical protein